MKTLIISFTLGLVGILNVFGNTAVNTNTSVEPPRQLKPGRYILIFSDQEINGKTFDTPQLSPLIVDISQKGKDTVITLENDPTRAPSVVKISAPIKIQNTSGFDQSVTFALTVHSKLQNSPNGIAVTHYLNCAGDSALDNDTGVIPNAFRGSVARLDVYSAPGNVPGNAQAFIESFLLYPIDKKSKVDKSTSR